jgi:hypothetical protein
MKAMPFSNEDRKNAWDDAFNFVGEVGSENVSRIEVGSDGIKTVITVYYTEK